MKAGSVHHSLAQPWPSCTLRCGQALLRDRSGRAAGGRIRHRLRGGRGELFVQHAGECSCPKPWRIQADRCRNRRKHGPVHRSRLGPAPVAVVLRPPLSRPICTAGRQGARGGVRFSYTGHFGDFHGFGICRFDALFELSGQGVAGTARNCACWPGAFPCRQGRGCPRNAARAASAGCSAYAGCRHAGRAAAPSFPGQRERKASW